jgi:hypothetical protein
VKKKGPHILILGPVRATRSETILPDGIESDDSDKDHYQPDDADLVQEAAEDDEVETDDDDDVENEDEVGFEKKVVASKKGKAKLGCREITAIRTTVPTTGTKSAVEYRDSGGKRRERTRSSRSVPLILGDQFSLMFSSQFKPITFTQESEEVKPAAFRISFWLGLCCQSQTNCIGK